MTAQSPLAKAIRAAAKRQGLTLEALRTKLGMSNTLFYEQLLAGEEPKKLLTLERLHAAGVRIPKELTTFSKCA